MHDPFRLCFYHITLLKMYALKSMTKYSQAVTQTSEEDYSVHLVTCIQLEFVAW